ncbi:HNH endonuclease, partial [Burkholderia multivorans]
RMITVRDDVCRTPWCEATIKHVDHATPVAAGGATSWDNASGLCAACNYINELPGWLHRTSATELSVTTPTGHRYTVSTRPIDARSTCPVDARPRSPGAAQEEGQARAPGSPPRTIAILAET